MKKLLSLAIGIALLLTPRLSTPIQRTAPKTHTITISNITDRDVIIEIIRPDEKPCKNIGETIKAEDTKSFTISAACPLVKLKAIDTLSLQEKSISQLTHGIYTKFLIELNQT